MSKAYDEQLNAKAKLRPRKPLQLVTGKCHLCGFKSPGAAKRLRWHVWECRCETGEAHLSPVRFEALAAGLVTGYAPGTHAHGAWLCELCVQRPLDFEAAQRSSPSPVVGAS